MLVGLLILLAIASNMQFGSCGKKHLSDSVNTVNDLLVAAKPKATSILEYIDAAQELYRQDKYKGTDVEEILGQLIILEHIARQAEDENHIDCTSDNMDFMREMHKTLVKYSVGDAYANRAAGRRLNKLFIDLQDIFISSCANELNTVYKSLKRNIGKLKWKSVLYLSDFYDGVSIDENCTLLKSIVKAAHGGESMNLLPEFDHSKGEFWWRRFSSGYNALQNTYALPQKYYPDFGRKNLQMSDILWLFDKSYWGLCESLLKNPRTGEIHNQLMELTSAVPITRRLVARVYDIQSIELARLVCEELTSVDKKKAANIVLAFVRNSEYW